MFSIGIITSVQSFGCIVHFYDNVHALIPISELSDEYVKTPSDLFSVGQVMKCRILSVDAANEKMRASFKLRSKSGNPSISIEVMEKIEVGTITNGTVTAILLDGLMINIPSFNIEGFLPKTQMSDNLTHVDKLFSLVTEGDEFSELLILSKDARRGQLLLSLKPWMIHSAKSGAVKNVQELKAGMVLPGFVKNVTETACFISLVGDFTAMSTLHNISDMFVSNASDNFVNGQSVIAHISKVDYDQMKIYVNLKESILLGSSKLKEFEHIRLKAFMEEREKIRKSAIKTKDLNECLSWSNNFPVSGYAEGSVKSIMPYGTILDMKLGGSGLITNYTKTSYKQGDVISGQILDVDISKKIVDLGLINRGKVEIPNQDKKSVSKVYI
jgi:rRNA biogenesis protein RRP5